jgi:hypothetical protein
MIGHQGLYLEDYTGPAGKRRIESERALDGITVPHSLLGLKILAFSFPWWRFWRDREAEPGA